MSKAFSLIEVIIAVIILSIAGMALLEASIQNTKINGYINKKTTLYNILSIVAFHRDIKYNKLNKPLYNFLENEYTINHDKLRNYLKKTTIAYREDHELFLNFSKEIKNDNQSDETKQEEFTNTTQDNEGSQQLDKSSEDLRNKLSIRKLSVNYKGLGTHLYFLNL